MLGLNPQPKPEPLPPGTRCADPLVAQMKGTTLSRPHLAYWRLPNIGGRPYLPQVLLSFSCEPQEEILNVWAPPHKLRTVPNLLDPEGCRV